MKKLTREDLLALMKTMDRFFKEIGEESIPRMTLLIDLKRAVAHFNIDVNKLNESNDETFFHDLIGIVNNTNRTLSNGTEDDYNLWCPRTARAESEEV